MSSSAQTEHWLVFGLVFAILLFLDLFVSGRGHSSMSLRTAVSWCVLWVTVAAAFGFYVLSTMGSSSGLEFFTGYIVEQALSVDNIFVFIVIFSYFGVPSSHQRRVLFYGILGALVMRALFIVGGTALLHRFEWLMYGLGLLLIVSGVKLLRSDFDKIQPDKNPLVRLCQRFVPLTSQLHGERFWVREGGLFKATPLFLVLVSIEFTDLVFAVDSIPAVLAISRDPFIVFTSNVFAIVGLRSLYFVVSGAMKELEYLNVGLSLVLVFIGVKMLFLDKETLPTWLSLIVIVVFIGGAVIFSLAHPGRKRLFDDSSGS